MSIIVYDYSSILPKMNYPNTNDRKIDGAIRYGIVVPWYARASNCVAAYQPKGAASLAASYTNLANPGVNDAAPGVAPAWDVVNGWSFNGTTQYLTTGLVPAAGWSMIAGFTNTTLPTQYHAACGLQDTSTNTRFYLMVSLASRRYYGYGTSSINISPNVNSGIMCLAGVNCYLNGVSDGTVSASWVVQPRSVYLGARNIDGSPDAILNGTIQAVAIYSSILTRAQAAVISAAMAAL